MNNNDYTLPEVWTWDAENGGEWAGINRPIAGATHEKNYRQAISLSSFTHWARLMASR